MLFKNNNFPKDEDFLSFFFLNTPKTFRNLKKKHEVTRKIFCFRFLKSIQKGQGEKAFGARVLQKDLFCKEKCDRSHFLILVIYVLFGKYK